MSYASVSSHWGATTFDDDSMMEIASDRGVEDDNSFLRPVPRGLPEDEDMIDLSPRPSPRPSPQPETNLLDPDPATLHKDDDMSGNLTHTPQPNEMDEITFEEEDLDDDGDDTNAAVAYDESSHGQEPEPSHGEEDAPSLVDTTTNEKYPDLIDYGDEDDEINLQDPVDIATNDEYAQQNEYIDARAIPPSVDEPETSRPAEAESDTDPDIPAAQELQQAGGDSEVQTYNTEEHVDATENLEKLATDDQPKYSSHPIVVDFYNQWISLFKGSLPELEDCFDVEEEVLYGNIALTFEWFRKSRFVDVKDWENLEIHVPALDLWVREKSEDAEQYSFADLLNTYLDLHSHDGHYAPDPLFLTLTVRPIFRHQLEKLQRVTGNSEGFSKCDFLNSRQPAFQLSASGSGETVQDTTNENTQHQESVADDSNEQTEEPADPESTLPSNRLSPTLSGQSAESADGPDGADGVEQDDQQQGDVDEHAGEYEEGYPGGGYGLEGGTLEGDYDGDHQGFGQTFEVDSGYPTDNQEQESYGDTNIAPNEAYEAGTAPEVGEEGQGLYDDGTQNYGHAYEQVDGEPSEEANQGAFNEAGSYDQLTNTVNTETENHDEDAFGDEHGFAQELGPSGNDHVYTEISEGFAHDPDGDEGDGNEASYEDSYVNTVDFQPEEPYQDAGEAEYGEIVEESEFIEEGDGVDASIAVAGEGDFLIDYSDNEDEGQQPKEEIPQTQAAVLEQVQNPEDEISYSDDEEAEIKKTPTKRARSDDDTGSEPKRVKSEVGS